MDLGKGMGPGANPGYKAFLVFPMATLIICPACGTRYNAPSASRVPTGPAPDLSTGDSVRHSTLGEGVVVRIEGDGIVTVRFAQDGAERRLMLDYAPLEKIL